MEEHYRHENLRKEIRHITIDDDRISTPSS